MSELIYLIIGCYGLTSIVVQSKLFNPFRKWVKIKLPFIGKLVSCMFCFGFWVSILIVTLFNYSFSNHLFLTYTMLPNIIARVIFTIFDAAFLASLIYHINLIELYVESKLPNEQ